MLERLRRIKNIGLFLNVLCVSIAISTPTFQTASGMDTNGKMKFYLTRTQYKKDRTLGTLTFRSTDGPIVLYTLEPPQRVQKPRTIPAGIYVVEVLMPRGTDQPRLRLRAVEGFSNVYLEVGNFPRDTKGCILVGLSAEGEELRGSRKAFQILLDSLGTSQDFMLIVTDTPHR